MFDYFLPLKLRFRVSQIIIITNFVVVSSVGIKRIMRHMCLTSYLNNIYRPQKNMIVQKMYRQSNLNGSTIFGTFEICSRHGKFEPLRVNHSVRLGGKSG